MHDWLEAVGFTFCADVKICAYDATAYRCGDIWLFDVRPMNFVVNDADMTSPGEIVPIDIILQGAPWSARG